MPWIEGQVEVPAEARGKVASGASKDRIGHDGQQRGRATIRVINAEGEGDNREVKVFKPVKHAASCCKSHTCAYSMSSQQGVVVG